MLSKQIIDVHPRSDSTESAEAVPIEICVYCDIGQLGMHTMFCYLSRMYCYTWSRSTHAQFGNERFNF